MIPLEVFPVQAKFQLARTCKYYYDSISKEEYVQYKYDCLKYYAPLDRCVFYVEQTAEENLDFEYEHYYVQDDITISLTNNGVKLLELGEIRCQLQEYMEVYCIIDKNISSKGTPFPNIVSYRNTLLDVGCPYYLLGQRLAEYIALVETTLKDLHFSRCLMWYINAKLLKGKQPNTRKFLKKGEIETYEGSATHDDIKQQADRYLQQVIWYIGNFTPRTAQLTDPKKNVFIFGNFWVEGGPTFSERSCPTSIPKDSFYDGLFIQEFSYYSLSRIPEEHVVQYLQGITGSTEEDPVLLLSYL